MWQMAIVSIVAFVFGAAAFALGVVVGARLVWRASGQEGELRLRMPKPPEIEQEFTK